MLFSNYALKFVDYPTQVIAKSCKPIPGAVLAERTQLLSDASVTVMISGLFINRKRYPLAKYVLISLVAIGISLFMYNPKVCSNHKRLFLTKGVAGGQGREASALYWLRHVARVVVVGRRDGAHTGTYRHVV